MPEKTVSCWRMQMENGEIAVHLAFLKACRLSAGVFSNSVLPDGVVVAKTFRKDERNSSPSDGQDAFPVGN